MDFFIFITHKGHFFHMNPPSKIQGFLGEKYWVHVEHGLTHILESSNINDDNRLCSNENNYRLEECIYEVSNYL